MLFPGCLWPLQTRGCAVVPPLNELGSSEGRGGTSLLSHCREGALRHPCA